MRLNRTILAILLAGLVAGTIDIGAACLIGHLPPQVIMQAIASGVLGKASFKGGANTAFVGLLLQWAMSIVIAAIYIGLAQMTPALKRLWIAGGLAYGVVIYLVMNFVVVPLSNAPFKHHAFNPTKAGEDVLAMLLFGLIVARFARSVAA